MDRLARIKQAAVGAVLSLPLVAMATPTNAWDSAFDGIENQFATLLTSAYALMGVVFAGIVIFGLVKKLGRKASS